MLSPFHIRLYILSVSILLKISGSCQNPDCTYFENYDNNSLWTFIESGPEIGCSTVPRGDIFFEDGKLKWDEVRDGGYDTRNYYDLGFTLCDSWTAEIDITILEGGFPSVGPFSLSVIGLTSGTDPMIGYYTNGGNIIQANQDGIITYLTSSSQSDWMFRVGLRDGTQFDLAETIPINTGYGVTYHIKLQRINTISGYITITSDDFTPSFSASACFDIPATITNLTHFQQGNTPIGSCERSFTGEMDNFCLKNCTNNTVGLIEGTTEYSLCAGETFIPDLSDIFSGNTYQWIPTTGISNANILNPIITVYQSASYAVIATGDCGITDTLIVTIVVGANDTIEINGESQITACPNSTTTPELEINTSENSFSWAPTTGLSDPTVLNPEITVSQPTSYILTATNPCAGTTTFQISVNLIAPLDFQLDPEVSICSGDTFEIPGVLNSPATITWANSNALSSLDIPNPLAFPTTTTTFQVSVTDQCETLNKTIDVIINEAPVITGISDLDICVGDTAFANVHNTGNFEVTSWNWTPTTGLKNPAIANPGIFNVNDETYQIHAANSCGTDIFDVHLHTFTLDFVLNLDSIVCPGEPIPLSASGATSYSWFPSQAMDNPHANVTTAHIYTDQLIQLQLSGGTCVKIVSDLVHVYHNIGFSQLDPVNLFPGESYDLSYLEDEYGIVFNESPIVSFYSDTTIALVYSDHNGCEFSLYLPVTVEPVLYVPNSFTPDGDGLNDIFKAVGLNIKNFKMQIYNRYGNLVFESYSLNDGWNGGANGYYYPNDIYNYIIEYTFHSTEVKMKRGFVVLLR